MKRAKGQLPPPTAFAPGPTPAPRTAQKAAAARRHVPPPPTRFAPGNAGQGKTDRASFAGAAYPPPPTKFAPGGVGQAKAGAPKSAGRPAPPPTKFDPSAGRPGPAPFGPPGGFGHAVQRRAMAGRGTIQRSEDTINYAENKLITFAGQEVRVVGSPSWVGRVRDMQGNQFQIENSSGDRVWVDKHKVVYSSAALDSGAIRLPSDLLSFLIKEPVDDYYYHATAKSNVASIIESGGLVPRSALNTTTGFVGLDKSRNDTENTEEFLKGMHEIHGMMPDFANKNIVEAMLGPKADYIYVTRRWDTVEDYAREIKEKYNGGDSVIFRFKIGGALKYNDAQSASAVRLRVKVATSAMQQADWRAGTDQASDLTWGLVQA